MITNIIAGVALFVAGAVVALAWVYRDQIRLLIGLQKSGAVDQVGALAGDVKGIIDSIRGKKTLPTTH